jgi:hypothetical protein
MYHGGGSSSHRSGSGYNHPGNNGGSGVGDGRYHGSGGGGNHRPSDTRDTPTIRDLQPLSREGMLTNFFEFQYNLKAPSNRKINDV